MEDQLINNMGITVAYLVTSEGYHVAYSRCNWKYDLYNKKRGRAICIGRLLHGNYYKVPKREGSTDFETVVAFINDKVDTDVPQGPVESEAAQGEDTATLSA
jgi:hypothetical protein